MEKDILDHILDFTYRLFGISNKGKKKPKKQLAVCVQKYENNPIISPNKDNFWEAIAVFNPAAVLINNRIHLLYRAIGHDGVSRIGYASSADGINFDDRLTFPVFIMSNPRNKEMKGKANRYDPIIYASGGSWGGCEDPRIVVIDNTVHVTFNAFDGWDFIRIGAIVLNKDDFISKNWYWSCPLLLSPVGEIHKNWVLFPEKIKGKYAILHSITPNIQIDYVENLEDLDSGVYKINSNFTKEENKDSWDTWLRGVGPPPIKTSEGWLVLYHAIEEQDPGRYKIGAMLLDIDEPTKIKARAIAPILSPDMHYENDWKPGVVYTCGAVVKDGKLFIYYGGGDKYTCIAHVELEKFLYELTHGNRPRFSLGKFLFNNK